VDREGFARGPSQQIDHRTCFARVKLISCLATDVARANKASPPGRGHQNSQPARSQHVVRIPALLTRSRRVGIGPFEDVEPMATVRAALRYENCRKEAPRHFDYLNATRPRNHTFGKKDILLE